ncbi:hypothetical protein Tco_1004420 [Tanacetum coccineum]|uniref:Uncharacterized protein n=1 Tax=Tanacetum coccineum TaxID=301880 RepID=A0ABQ5FCC7_9ASTR
MAAFWVVNNQFQKFIDSKFTLDYDSQMTDTYFVEYTGLEVQHFRDTLLQHLGNVKKSVAERISIKDNDTQVFTMTIEILPEPTSNKLYDRSDAYGGNHVKEILFNLNLPDHRSVLMEQEFHVKMEMEIPRSSKVKFITACSYSFNKYKDMIKAQIYVIQVFRYFDTQKVFLEVIMCSRLSNL